MVLFSPRLCVSAVSLAKDHQSTRERRAALCPAELQPTPDKSRPPMNRVIVPPFRIRARRHQAHHQSSPQRFLVSLSHPKPDFPPVRWIHKDPVLRPILFQAILGQSEMLIAFCILVRATRVQREIVNGIQPIEEILRRRPLIRTTSKMNTPLCGSSSFKIGVQRHAGLCCCLVDHCRPGQVCFNSDSKCFLKNVRHPSTSCLYFGSTSHQSRTFCAAWNTVP